MASDELPSVFNIRRNHDLIVEEYDLDNPGVTDPFWERKLQQIIEEAAEQETPYMRAATLLKRIAAVHIYEDGNKRTAWITTVEYLDRLGKAPAVVESTQVDRVTRSLSRFSTTEIAAWLRDGTIDRERIE